VVAIAFPVRGPSSGRAVTVVSVSPDSTVPEMLAGRVAIRTLMSAVTPWAIAVTACVERFGYHCVT
jgi:hypothetical protein